jgi:hypothetical protein
MTISEFGLYYFKNMEYDYLELYFQSWHQGK